MLPSRWIVAALVATAALSQAARAEACFCKNTAAVLTSVVYEPDAETATRVRMYGAFSFLADQVDLGSWSEPAIGYLYLECPAGSEEACRVEWQEIEAWSAQHDCPAFGDYEAPVPRVRPTTEPPGGPDPYGFIQFGGVSSPPGDACSAVGDALAAQPETTIAPRRSPVPAPAEEEASTPTPSEDESADEAPAGCHAASGSTSRSSGPPLAALLALLVIGARASRRPSPAVSQRRSVSAPRRRPR